MITREDIIKKIQYTNGSSTVATGHAADSMMELLEPYIALVDAAVAYEKRKGGHDSFVESSRLSEALQPFLPKPPLSEKLDKLADNEELPTWLIKQLRQLADEARNLEWELEQ